LISEEFYKLASADITYYYAGAQTSVALANYIYNETGRPISLNKEEYETLWKESFETYPISNPDLTRSTWFFFYIQSYLGYKNLVEDYNYDNTNETVKQEKTHSDVINIAKKYLTGKQLEYYYAAYLYDTAIYKNYEKELITLFKQFKEEYPSSKYTSFVESEIIPIIAFHKKQNETLNENIHFVENAGNINTLKEAIKNLNTNKVYVDVWATWCSPCKDEFKYNKELYELLKTKNITMLYLSVDKDNKHEAWKDMIKYYELEGYHIRINEKFYNELMDIRGRENAFYIPWHFTTDGEGKIIDINASGPSDILKLKKQLSS
jgi:thiol-disulfide isomerase/thioredoxin